MTLRYIDSNLAKAQFTGNFQDSYSPSEAKAMIDEVPTADVEPVRHAHWIRKSHEWDFSPYFYIDFTCSNCDTREQDKAPYCRYCGARMDEKVDK